MIRFQNFTGGYGGASVLRDVTLSFPAGEVTVLLGPNGSGKSSLLKAALGLLPQAQGTVLYGGAERKSLKPKQAAKKVAWLSQHRTAPELKALKLVLHGRFPHMAYPRSYSPEDIRIAREAMDATGTLMLEQRLVSALSGGQQQGVYLAMTLAQQAQTVLMDEPTAFLDIRHQLQLLKTAKELARQGRAVVMVLHDLPLALSYADRIVLLEDGEIRLAASPREAVDSGALERVFGIRLFRMETPHGDKYYITGEDV